jgi:DNA-damage-inducible protein D
VTWFSEFKMGDNKIIMFGEKKIRRVLHNGDWFFSVVDVVGILSGSDRPRKYWADLKKKLSEEGSELSAKIGQLKMESSDGKKYLTDCVNKQGIFRIIQSIPSKKAEPFKLWLAKVGSERIDEIENPELAQNRAREYYEKKCYPKDWIDKRLRGIAIRQDLTKEWDERGVGTNREYAILTNEISYATFGVSIKDHKKIKNLNVDLKNENLRDSMTDLELIFSMLGEKVSTEITKEEDLEGFDECLEAGVRGGNVAGKARLDAEKEIGKKIVSEKNIFDLVKKKKKKILEVKK